MSPSIVFELCAETCDACCVAKVAGVHRIELCADLDVGGLTPSPALVAAAVKESGLPVHVLLRPTAATLQYSPVIFAAIARSMEEARQAGAAGFVLGLLDAGNRVDREHTTALVEQAAGLPVTFHRAFDMTPDLRQALEDVIATGCTRVLTSGGEADVLRGIPALARLVDQAGARIEVAVGGGLSLENVTRVVQQTGGQHFHASLRSPAGMQQLPARLSEMLTLIAGASAAVSACGVR